MTDTSHVHATLTVDGPPEALHAVDVALHADWARVLRDVEEGTRCTYTVDISTPTARTQPLPLLVRDPKVRARVEATSPEAPDKGFDGAVPEFQPPSGSAAECVIQRFGERYRVELGHEESDLRSHDVRVAAWVYAGRLPGGETAYWLASLGIGEQALTDELFTDAVAARRAA